MKEEQLTDERVIKIQAYGSFCFKHDVRDALNLQSSKQYINEINILKESVDDFDSLYKEQARKKKLTINLARIIVETIYDRAGEYVKVRFVFNQ